MRPRLLLLPLLAVLALLPSACSVDRYLPTTLVSATATPVPTPAPTVPPVDESSAVEFDPAAGNCRDAATQAIDLMSGALNRRFGAGSSFNMDMRLEIEPHDRSTACAESGHALSRFRQDIVYSAHLSVWPLDTVWNAAGSTIRAQWLADVLNAVTALYPRANVRIEVFSPYNGTPCGSASIGAGSGGTRQIAATCGF